MTAPNKENSNMSTNPQTPLTALAAVIDQIEAAVIGLRYTDNEQTRQRQAIEQNTKIDRVCADLDNMAAVADPSHLTEINALRARIGKVVEQMLSEVFGIPSGPVPDPPFDVTTPSIPDLNDLLDRLAADVEDLLAIQNDNARAKRAVEVNIKLERISADLETIELQASAVKGRLGPVVARLLQEVFGITA